jgi:hypothetical protein
MLLAHVRRDNGDREELVLRKWIENLDRPNVPARELLVIQEHAPAGGAEVDTSDGQFETQRAVLEAERVGALQALARFGEQLCDGWWQVRNER